MPRPRSVRHVAPITRRPGFRPHHEGVTGRVVLQVEELEAIRLADYEGLYQDAAAAQMRISRQTFGRILAQARRKVAAALLDGRALEVAEAGPEIVSRDAERGLAPCGCPATGPGPGGAACPRRRQGQGVCHFRRRRGWPATARVKGDEP